MSRRIVALVVLLVSVVALAPVVTPVRAGAQRWSAWLYDHTNGQMLLLTDTLGGSPQTLTLPMPSGFDIYGRTVAISHDWHYMAYVVSNAASNAHTIAVYDRNSGSIIYSIPIEATDSVSLDFSADELVFNEASTSLAF